MKKVGRKNVVIISAFFLGLFTLIYFNMTFFWLSLLSLLLLCFSASMKYTASDSLVLEQEPELRGTMMSLNSVSLGSGSAIGAGIGGMLLLSYGYRALGFLGFLSIFTIILYHQYVVDPANNNEHPNDKSS